MDAAMPSSRRVSQSYRAQARFSLQVQALDLLVSRRFADRSYAHPFAFAGCTVGALFHDGATARASATNDGKSGVAESVQRASSCGVETRRSEDFSRRKAGPGARSGAKAQGTAKERRAK